MPNTAAHRLAERLIRLQPEDIPAASRKAVKRLLLDYLGVAAAGSRTHSAQIAAQLMLAEGGRQECTLIGQAVKATPMQAAFANAITSHSVELDDIDVLALFHFSPPVYSAALAIAERAHASGSQLLAALAAGCEMMERASRATNPSLRDRAFHTTPTCGVFGAAAAAGKLLNLSQEQFVSALGLAGAQSGGLMEMYGPSMQKRFNPGPASRSGVTAALAAQLGFTGADTIFEGRHGFLHAYTDTPKPEALTQGLDQPYVLDIEFKPYACARPIHNAIDCALRIRPGVPRLDDIARIEVARHPAWASYHQNKAPTTYHEAQVSLPFATAVSLKEGAALLEQFGEDRLADAQLQRLMQSTTITHDDSLPRGVSCRMEVVLKDGRRLGAQVDDPKGSIGNPMSDAELAAKFQRLAEPVLGSSVAGRIAGMVDGLEQCKDVGELMALLRSPA